MEPKIRHLGIIMDGNRRWAINRNLPFFKGHRAGYKKIEEVLRWCHEAKIEMLTLFAFSTENWQRTKQEVDFLMRFLHLTLTRDVKKLCEKNAKIRIIGRKEGLSQTLRRAIAQAEKLTEKNTGSTLNLAINYSGRQEIVDALNKILKNPPRQITAETISENIYTANWPEPDLIIRTSGEIRLSGFLMWQSAYAELCFVKHHWPEFSRQDFENALADFAKRQRRFGK